MIISYYSKQQLKHVLYTIIIILYYPKITLINFPSKSSATYYPFEWNVLYQHFGNLFSPESGNMN
jgi:hypothetical protein